MRYLVFVKFLPGGSLAPEELFARINAQWYSLENIRDSQLGKADSERMTHVQSPKSAICIADFESIEQLAIDLSIMPGAGISNIEVVPVSEEMKHNAFVGDGPISDHR